MAKKMLKHPETIKLLPVKDLNPEYITYYSKTRKRFRNVQKKSKQEIMMRIEDFKPRSFLSQEF